MKTPMILTDYLESTEQDPEKMTDAELLEEAEWVLWECENDECYLDYIESKTDTLYTNSNVNSLRKYVSVLKA